MTNATKAIIEVLGVTEEQALYIQEIHDTTFDGSKWDEASYRQVIITAMYVQKAVA